MTGHIAFGLAMLLGVTLSVAFIVWTLNGFPSISEMKKSLFKETPKIDLSFYIDLLDQTEVSNGVFAMNIIHMDKEELLSLKKELNYKIRCLANEEEDLGPSEYCNNKKNTLKGYITVIDKELEYHYQ